MIFKITSAEAVSSISMWTSLHEIEMVLSKSCKWHKLLVLNLGSKATYGGETVFIPIKMIPGRVDLAYVVFAIRFH